MTPRILSLTFNGLTLLKRSKTEINTSKSETDPKNLQKNHFMLDMSEKMHTMSPARRSKLSEARFLPQ